MEAAAPAIAVVSAPPPRVVEEEDDEEKEEDDDDADDEEEEAEEEVYEVTIKGKTYYVVNEQNGPIYAADADGDVGNEVGRYINGEPKI